MGHIHLPHSSGPSPVQAFPQLHFLISTSHRAPVQIPAYPGEGNVLSSGRRSGCGMAPPPAHSSSSWVSSPLLAAKENLADSAGHSDVVPSRNGGHCSTRGFEH